MPRAARLAAWFLPVLCWAAVPGRAQQAAPPTDAPAATAAPVPVVVDKQVNHPNGTTLIVNSIQPRRTTTVVNVTVTTGKENVRLADFGMALADDAGGRYPVVPPVGNQDIAVPKNSALEGELVFSGRLNPAARRVTLVVNENGGSPSSPVTVAPQFRIEMLLPERRSDADLPDGPEQSLVASSNLPGVPLPAIAALDPSRLAAAAQEAGAASSPSLRPGGLSVAQLRQDLRTTQTARGELVSLPGDVLFDFDRATIRPDAAATLRKVAALVAGTSPRRVLVEGHTDARGGDAYNQRLSLQRAAAVADWLAAAGVDRGMMRTEGFGRTRPVAPNTRPGGADDPEGRQRNRRVEVVLQQA